MNYSAPSTLPAVPTLVSVHWLMERLGRSTTEPDYTSGPNIVIVDCRFSLENPALGRSQYQQGHIPGAVYFDLNRDLSSSPQKHGGRHPLPNPQELAAKLSLAGISSPHTGAPSHVVVYDDSRFAFAARLWWLLRYLGHEMVSLLDGGFHAWQEAGFPVTAEHSSPKLGNFQPQAQEGWVVNREQIKAEQLKAGETQSELVLIDSRTGDRYRGEYEPIDPIAGHIPEAVNYPWTDVTDERGYARSPKEQEQRWSQLDNTSNLIVYCGSGVTACVNLVSLHLAGLPSARLYAGSWSDWCSYEVD